MVVGRASGGAKSYSCCQVTDTSERSSGGGTTEREDDDPLARGGMGAPDAVSEFTDCEDASVASEACELVDISDADREPSAEAFNNVRDMTDGELLPASSSASA